MRTKLVLALWALVTLALVSGCFFRPCEHDWECGSGEYCLKDLCDAREGVCAPRWTRCDLEHVDPVCGCDGVTYQNECFATMSPVSIDCWGACPCP